MPTKTEALDIAVKVADENWQRDRALFEEVAVLFIRYGFKPDKKTKMSKDEVARDSWMKLAEDAYKTGLTRGYAMGHAVYHRAARRAAKKGKR